MAQDWDIKSRADSCQACQGPFEDRATYYSCLLFTEEEGYVRGDFCARCWPEKQANEKRPFSVWQGIFRLPPPPAQEALRKETAESLLRKLIEDDDRRRESVIYILAVMLERKRILVERDVQYHEDGGMTRIYEHRRSGETFLIRDPRLNINELASVQEEVVELLGGQTGNAGTGGGDAADEAVEKAPDTSDGEES
jgi:hypothetical protein